VESWRQEVKEKEVQLRQCQEGHDRLRAEQALPGGLAGLIAARFMDDRGIASQRLLAKVAKSPTAALRPDEVFSYRAAGTVAVSAKVEFPEGAAPWVMAMAELLGPGGRKLKVVRLWQGPLSDQPTATTVVIEAEATEKERQGVFTLKAHEANGSRSLILPEVTFP